MMGQIVSFTTTEKLEDVALYLEAKSTKKLTLIGTHSGAFHCDQALAVAMLLTLPDLHPCAVVRSRNKEIHEKMDILVDVGGQFDQQKKHFDHHQASFKGTFSAHHSIKLSSAGLVYKYYGKQLLLELEKKHKCSVGDNLEYVHQRLYDSFIKAIDGIDNGVQEVGMEGLNQEQKKEAKLVRRYKVSTDLSSRVGRLNPAWNTPTEEYDPSQKFKQACALAFSEFEEHFLSLINIILPAYSVVRDAFKNRKEVHESGKIMKLDKACPWREPLFDLEEEAKCKGQVLYALYPDMGGKWRIQAVPKQLGSFENRLSLKKEWQGVRDQELAKVSGVEGAVFVHATGFIGGAVSYEGVLKMGLLSIDSSK